MSKILDTLKTANGSLSGAKLRTALTVLSIMVGAFTLTLGLGVGAGLSQYIEDQVGEVSPNAPLLVSVSGLTGGVSTDLKVEPYDPNKDEIGNATMDADDLDAIRNVEGVERVEPNLDVPVEYLAYGSKKVTSRVAELLTTDDPKLAAGDVGPAREPGNAVIGIGYLKPLGIDKPEDAIGETLTLVVLDQLREAKQYQFTVAGVVEPNLVTNGLIQVPREDLETMQSYYASGVDDLTAQVGLANAYLDKGADPEAVKDRIGELDLVAETAADTAAAAGAQLRPLQLAVLGFSLVAIVASIFGIINTLLMSVHERTREVGLLKALGSKNRDIFGQFLAEALMLGLWGSIIGMVLALLTGGLVSRIVADRASETFPGLDIFSATLGTLIGAPLLIGVVAILAGVMPARRAMKLDPIAALRYE